MSLYPEDKRSAFLGFVIGAVALFALVFGIVKATNARFASHERPAAGASPAGH